MLQITQHDWNVLNDDNRDLWLNNYNMDAATFLLRNLAAEPNLEYSGLYYRDQIRHGGQNLRFDVKKVKLHLLSYNKMVGSGLGLTASAS